MARRRYTVRVRCAHPDCTEYAHFEASTRAEEATIYRDHGPGKWRCTRHHRADELLTPSSRKRTTEMALREEPHGKYWGSSGFVFGPGFKAFGKDFPTGTVLRVTAEVILPAGLLALEQSSRDGGSDV